MRYDPIDPPPRSALRSARHNAPQNLRRRRRSPPTPRPTKVLASTPRRSTPSQPSSQRSRNQSLMTRRSRRAWRGLRTCGFPSLNRGGRLAMGIGPPAGRGARKANRSDDPARAAGCAPRDAGPRTTRRRTLHPSASGLKSKFIHQWCRRGARTSTRGGSLRATRVIFAYINYYYATRSASSLFRNGRGAIDGHAARRTPHAVQHAAAAGPRPVHGSPQCQPAPMTTGRADRRRRPRRIRKFCVL